jgi:hypothetical protein
LDSNASVVNNVRMTPFPSNILDLVDNDGQGKNTGSDPGVYFLRVKHIIPRNNGTVDLLCEVDVVTMGSEKTLSNTSQPVYNIVYGDIIDVNLGKNDHAIFTRIPKRQEGRSGDWGLGFYPIVFGDKLVLLYNDHRDNMTRDVSKSPEHYFGAKKGVLASAMLDGKGNLARQAIYTFRDEKRLAAPQAFYRIGDTKHMVVSMYATSLFSTRVGFGMLEVK